MSPADQPPAPRSTPRSVIILFRSLLVVSVVANLVLLDLLGWSILHELGRLASYCWESVKFLATFFATPTWPFFTWLPAPFSTCARYLACSAILCVFTTPLIRLLCRQAKVDTYSTESMVSWGRFWFTVVLILGAAAILFGTGELDQDGFAFASVGCLLSLFGPLAVALREITALQSRTQVLYSWLAL